MMAQNKSSAVMQQRLEPHDSLDDFPTPPWAGRALCEHVIHPHLYSPGLIQEQRAWEPACNRGYLALGLSDYFGDLYCTDIHDYGWPGQHEVADFLWPSTTAYGTVDWIITNPPFRLAQEFIEKGLEWADKGVAVLVRTAFLEGIERHQDLFSKNPPTIIAQFVERVAMVKGRYDPEASSATAYCWLVWQHGLSGTKMVWIPKCRRELERASDFPLPKQISNAGPLFDYEGGFCEG